MIRFSIVGTTKLCVTCSFCTASSQSFGSNCGRITSVRPPQTDDMIGVTPATWNIGTESSVTSGSSLGSAGLIVFVTYTERLRYVSATPFGCDVVPDV